LIVPIRIPRRFNSGTNFSINVVFPLPDLPTIDRITGILPPDNCMCTRNSFAVKIIPRRFAAIGTPADGGRRNEGKLTPVVTVVKPNAD
jgi:hypothetical protein